MATWLLIILLGGGAYGVKYLEFPSKQACDAAATAMQSAGTKAVCVEGGKPILEPQVVATPAKPL